MERWLSEDLEELVAEQRMPASTLASYRKNVRLHVAPEIGNIALAELRGEHIKAMRVHLLDHGRKDHRAGEGLSVRTVSYCAVILQAALTDAVEQGIIPINPALQRSRRGRQGKSKPGLGEQAVHAWTKSQMRAFLRWCESSQAPDHVAYHLLAHTGLRRGEALALRWRDVVVDWKDDNVDRGHLSVSRAIGVIKVKGEPERILEDSKKTGVARSVALDPDTVRRLRRWRLARSEFSLASGRPDQLVNPGALVFGTVDGGYRHPDRFSRQFMAKQDQCRRRLKDECSADDLPPVIRLHDLRHSHGTQLYLDGHPLKVIAERLGHDEVVLLRTYTHLSANSQEDMIRRSYGEVAGQ